MFDNIFGLFFLLFAVVGAFAGFSANRKINNLTETVRGQRTRMNRLQERLDVLAEQRSTFPDPEMVTKTEVKEAVSEPDVVVQPESTRDEILVWESGSGEYVRSAPTEKKSPPALPPKLPPMAAKIDAPKPESVPEFSDEPVGSTLQEKLMEKINFPTGKTTEEIIYSYVLPRLGVLGIGIAVFIVLALVAKEMGAVGRVAIGYSIAAAMLGLGRFSESKQPKYAQVAYGGGLAVAYLVTFGTHFLEFAKLTESPYPSLGGMAFIVGIWAWMAQRKQSPVLGMVVTALGHFTILLSVGSIKESPGITAFSILILSTGSAWFLLRNRWYYVAAVGLVLSYLNHGYLMVKADSAETVLEFSLGLGVLTTYFLIYSLAELFSPEHIRRKSVPVFVRTAFVSVNTGMYLLLGSLIMEGFDFSTDRHHWFHYGLGAMLLVVGAGYWKRRNHDPLLNAYFTKASGIITLGLAYQFSGSALATSLAVEMLVLLAASRQSTLIVTRLLAYAVGILAFGVAFDSAVSNTALTYDSAEFVPTAIQFGLVTVAFWLGSILYERTKWDEISPAFGSLDVATRQFLWRLDLASRGEDWNESVQKHANGYLLPMLYACAGFALANMQVFNIVDDLHMLFVLGILGLGLLLVGWVVRSMSLTSLTLGFVVTGLGTFLYLFARDAYTWQNWIGVACLIPIGLATEEKWFGDRKPFEIHANRWVPYGVYPMLTIMIVGLGLDWADTDQSAYIVALSAVAVLGGLAFVLHPKALCISGGMVFAFTWMAWNVDYPATRLSDVGAIPQSYLMVTAVALMALGIVGDRLTRLFEARWIGTFLQVSVMVVAMRFAVMQLPETVRDWGAVSRLLVVLGFVAYAKYCKTQTAAVLAGLSLVMNTFYLMAKSYDYEMNMAPMLAGFVGVIGVWILLERLFSTYDYELTETARKQAGGTLVGIVTVVSLYTFTRIPFILENYLTVSWALLAVALFFGAVVTKVGAYRYGGLVVLVISIGRVVLVDTTGLDAIPKAMAYGGLGVVCLGLGWLYIRIFGFSQSEKGDEESSEETP